MKKMLMLAALVAAPAFAPALAQGPAADRTQVVSHADLDLARAGDVRKLDRRINSAVNHVCGTASSADPAGKNEVRRCRVLTRESLAAERGTAIAAASQPTRVALASER